MRWTCAVVLVAAVCCPAARADEDAATKWAEGAGGKLTRDAKAPGKPVVGVQFDPRNKKLTDDGLKELKGFKGLRSLSLFYCGQIGDEGMKHVKELAGLEELVLNSTGVGDSGLGELKGLKKLRSLSLAGCIRVTDKATETIGGFTDLEELSLPSTVTEKGVKNLKGLKKLTSLYIGGARLTDAAVKDIADNMPELVSLELGAFDGTNITDSAVPDLARLTKLKSLGIQGSKITDTGLKSLKDKLPGCTIKTK
jgi:hypothetical protein